MSAPSAARSACNAEGVVHPSMWPIPPRLSESDTPRSSIVLGEFVRDRARPIDRLPPVFEGPTGVGDSQVFDDVDQSILTFGELIGQGNCLVEQDTQPDPCSTDLRSRPGRLSGLIGTPGIERRVDGPDPMPSDNGV